MKKGEMLSKAILLATNAHAGQFDKGGNPYILHPLTVMHKLKTSDE
jgi:(p)ppGpp synthase/HD superfamily hydrolase